MPQDYKSQAPPPEPAASSKQPEREEERFNKKLYGIERKNLDNRIFVTSMIVSYVRLIRSLTC